MDMRPAIILALILIPSVLALKIDIQIEEQAEGHLSWLNATAGPPQKFLATWENTGSVVCRSRARIDLHNATKKVYTSWGREILMVPGETFTWNLYSYLEPGQYNYTLMVYHCNDIQEYGPYQIQTDYTPTEAGLEIVNSNADESGVEVFVTSSADAKDVVVIPEKYPAGWTFEQGRIGSIMAGETKSVKLAYEPIEWEGKTINLVVATEDGIHAQRKPVILRSQAFPYDRVAFILIMIAALVIYLYSKKSNFEIWKR